MTDMHAVVGSIISATKATRTRSLRRCSNIACHTPMLPAASAVDRPMMAAVMTSGTAGPSGGGSTPIMLVLSIITFASRKAMGREKAIGAVAAASAVSRLRRWRSCAVSTTSHWRFGLTQAATVHEIRSCWLSCTRGNWFCSTIPLCCKH